MSEIFAFGPWAGEFGGELEVYQGRLRYLHRRVYPDSIFIVSGYAERSLLYEHANVYLPIPECFVKQIRDGLYFARWNTLVKTGTEKALKPDEGIMGEINQWFREETVQYGVTECLHPNTSWPTAFIDGAQQEYVLLRTNEHPNIPKRSIAVFPRQRLNNTFRNWSEDNWIKLIHAITQDRTAVIIGPSYEVGLKDLEGPNIINIIGADLHTQVSYLQDCALAVAPMCGAIRFTSYVGTPVVTFAPKGYYAQVIACEGKPVEANPFGTPVYALASNNTWDYTYEAVLAHLQSITDTHNL